MDAGIFYTVLSGVGVVVAYTVGALVKAGRRRRAKEKREQEAKDAELDLPVTPFELRELHSEADQEKIKKALRIIRKTLRAEWQPGRKVVAIVPGYGGLKTQMKDDIREELEKEGWRLTSLADPWGERVGVEEIVAAEKEEAAG